MEFILTLLADAGVLLLLARYMASVRVTDYKAALIVALIIALMNATIGWLIRAPMNLLTLGLLTSIVRIVVTAIMVKVAAKLSKSFDVDGWLPAFIIAIGLALTSALVESMIN